MADDSAAPPGGAHLPAPAPVGRRRVGVLAAVASTVLLVDVLTKLAVVDRLEGRTPVELLGGLVELRVIRNAGAAFGLGVGMTVVFSLVAVAVAVAIVRIAPRLRSLAWAVSLGLVLGGAVGNLVDRVFRSPGVFQGHVVDFVDVRWFPWIFNVADSGIVVGGLLMVLTTLRGVDHDGTRQPAHPAPEASEGADRG